MPLNKKQQKTQAIIKAATQYFLRFGYNGATTDLIQKEAGVSKATLYNHFPTKESLFASVVTSQCNFFVTRVKTIGLPDEDFRGSLNRIGTAYLTLLLEADNLALFRAVVAEAERFPGLAKTFYDAGPQSVKDVIAEAINRAMTQHEISLNKRTPAQLAGDFITVLRGQSQMYCLLHADFTAGQQDIASWVEQAVDIIFEQLATTTTHSH
ncbi:TetR/AcrR family transcriptional regulator [Alteromonas lipolytica]|uniref:HTH tetR-type domain-containing protein n=1 Tax=Alteromonas lipolytica TaxID=1856405 RepID=A0A1E8FCQ6_9ALTE|nr:TetR/AcrR family transcriptional regulator [Alteromonas lipolytica]OFI33700.1 hypothetical protein BFC17_19160 [Alteromonas lipolytica]GGF69241.1 TetR family transcriptional regulator [Alteromonas lipolytica]